MCQYRKPGEGPELDLENRRHDFNEIPSLRKLNKISPTWISVLFSQPYFYDPTSDP